MASARDVILVGVLLFVIGIGMLIVNYVTNTMVDTMIAIPVINSSTAARQALTDTQDMVNAPNSRLDYVMLGLFMGLTLGLIVAGYYVGGEPIFMFFYFLMIVIGVIVSMILANTWHSITDTGTLFNTALSNLPITSNLMTFLPVYITVIGILGIIVMFVKPMVSSQ